MVARRRSLRITLLTVSTCVLLFILVDIAVNTEQYYSESRTVTNGTPKIAFQDEIPTLKSENKFCSTGTVMFDTYCILSPYEDELRNTSNVGLVTLCTQATIEFLQHVPVLCHRWSAPISVAVYSPEEDYVDARILVHLLRKCDACVRNWVSWHFFIQNQIIPEIPYSRFVGRCNDITQERPKKRRSGGTYPINVGRNVARRRARTSYVFSTDIELYPSLNIPEKFERMIQSRESDRKNHVWVLPVFEVYSQYKTPFTKLQLKDMFLKKQAISFHKYRCNICHRIPNLTQWMENEIGNRTEVEDSLEPLKVFTTVKRSKQYKLQYWEPFFIGTTSDPEFDVRLSWEGKQNKMQVAYEMCMREYDFHIVENAFLVHTPGINVYNAAKEKFRKKHAIVNLRIMSSIKRELIREFKSRKGC